MNRGENKGPSGGGVGKKINIYLRGVRGKGQERGGKRFSRGGKVGWGKGGPERQSKAWERGRGGGVKERSYLGC